MKTILHKILSILNPKPIDNPSGDYRTNAKPPEPPMPFKLRHPRFWKFVPWMVGIGSMILMAGILIGIVVIPILLGKPITNYLGWCANRGWHNEMPYCFDNKWQPMWAQGLAFWFAGSLSLFVIPLGYYVLYRFPKYIGNSLMAEED